MQQDSYEDICHSKLCCEHMRNLYFKLDFTLKPSALAEHSCKACADAEIPGNPNISADHPSRSGVGHATPVMRTPPWKMPPEMRLQLRRFAIKTSKWAAFTRKVCFKWWKWRLLCLSESSPRTCIATAQDFKHLPHFNHQRFPVFPAQQPQ